MSMITRIRMRLRALFRRAAVEREMTEEMRTHIEQESAWLMRTEGLSREEARRRAHVSFGGLTRFEERTRDVRGVRPLEDFVRDVRHAVRTLRRSPTFSVVVVLTLGTGIGAVTGIFALLNSIVLQPLPYPDADELVAVRHSAPGLGLAEAGLSTGTYLHYRAHGSTLQGLAIYYESVLNLAGDDGAERIRLTDAGPDLFRVLRAEPMIGRMYEEADWTGSSMDLNWTIPILLSYDFWQHRFGGDPSIIGTILMINDSPREVFGVMPRGFSFPSSETQVWRMHMPHEASAAFAAAFDYPAIGRLRGGANIADARTDLRNVLASIEGAYRDATPSRIAEVQLSPEVVPLKTTVIGDAARTLWILLGAMSFLLLVACANVANLFIVRAESRAREVAVRTALGASRSVLARLLLAESLVLSALGAALGLVLATAGLQLLVAFTPVELPRLAEVRLDGRAFAVTLALTVIVAVLFGLLSLLRHARSNTLGPALKSGYGAAGGGRERRRLIDALVAAQVALALALLAGSVLMVQSYSRLTSVDPGYDEEHVLTVEVGVPSRRAIQHRQLYDAVADRMRRIPGVIAVGGVSTLPLTGGGDEHPLRPADPDVRAASPAPPVAFRFFVPGYFDALRTQTVDGISFAAGERTELEHPVVISEALARRLFPGERAVGRQIVRLTADGEAVTMMRRVDGARIAVELPPYTVAGIVRDMRDESLHARGGEVIYVPVIEPRVEQSIMSTHMTFVLRTDVPPLALVAFARSAVYDVDPTLSIASVRAFEDIVAASTGTERFIAVLLLIAGVASLLLAAVGIYGISAYTVRRRTPEIGLRVALGATPTTVVAMVLRDSLRVVALGAVVGVAAALAGARALRALLFEVSPTNPAVLAGVTALLGAVAFVATLLPARRAARTDGMNALRAE